MINGDGQILLCKPSGEYDGYAWTFPKGRPTAGERPDLAALREVLEETGYHGTVRHRLPGRYVGGATVTEYFLMEPIGEPQAFGQEIEAVQWAGLLEAERLIGQTRNPKGRKRDLLVLHDAVVILTQPISRCGLVVHKGCHGHTCTHN